MNAEEIFNELVIFFKNNGRSSEKLILLPNVNDYSIKIFDGPFMKIKCGKKCYIYLKNTYMSMLESQIKTQVVKNPIGWNRFEVTDFEWITKIQKVLLMAYDDALFVSGNTFGCCHLFIECSDALKCISPFEERARLCIYRRNLEAGKIFYGKNANINVKR